MASNPLKLVILLIVVLVALAVEFVLGATSFTGWIARHIANPKNAPFVMGCGLFAVFIALFARAFQRQSSAVQDIRGLKASGDGAWILWLCVAIFAVAAYWFASTTGGKV